MTKVLETRLYFYAQKENKKKEVREILVSNQIVEVTWGSRNKEWYINKGYKYTKCGDTFWVRVDDLMKNSKNKIEIECDYCHNIYTTSNKSYWESKAVTSLDKDCCRHCIGKKRYEANREERAVKMLSRLNEILLTNGYTLLTTIDEYVSIKQKFCFMCNQHGLQYQSGDNILGGWLCPKCSVIIAHNKKNPDEVEQIINSVNNNILLNKEDYISVNTSNLKIKCKCGNIFITSLGNYTHHPKNKCNRCTKIESKGEAIIRRVLEYGNIYYEKQKRFSECKDRYTLPFDFYLPTYNLLIEYDGEGHYLESFYEGISDNPQKSLQDRNRKDTIKNVYCEQNNIHLLRIPYWEIDNIKEIILNKIKELDKNFR